jgi:hypothetical protein
MANKDPKNMITNEDIEDVTQYGEFISSFHQWTTFDNQKRIANHLEDCTMPGYKEKVPRSSRK